MIPLLLGKLTGKFLPYLIAGTAIFALAFTAYFYYNNTQKKLAELNQLISANQVKISEQDKTISYQNERLVLQNKVQESITKNFQDARSQLADSQTAIDLNKLMTDNPDLLAKIINDNSGKSDYCFELYSGKNIADIEKDAAKQKTLLTFCGLK